MAALELVANRPIIHHVLDSLEASGIRDVTVVTRDDDADAVRESLADRGGPRRGTVRFAHQARPINLAVALSLIAPIVGDAPCVVHLADGLLGEPLNPFVEHLARDRPDLVLLVHQGSPASEVLSPATQKMLHLADFDRERASLAMAGVCLFGPGGLRHASGAGWGGDGEVDMTLVADQIAQAGGGLGVHFVHCWQRYGGDALELLELNRIALDRLEPNRQPSNNGNRIEGRVHIHESATVRNSVIIGPTIIGPGACIADAYIGPYTSIGADARIEGSEIERSIISERVSIMHVGGRLVASVVGCDARIFRDFSLPRALRLRVGDGTEVALC